MAVYKRNKVWYVYYYVKVNGRHKKKGVAVGSRKDIAEALDKKYREMTKAGIDPTMDQIDLSEIMTETLPITNPQKLTLKKFKPIFLELHGTLKSPKMQESYRSSLGHLLPVFGKTRLDEISKVKVKTFMCQRKREGASNATVNREVVCIKGILTKALEWSYINKHPLTGFKLFKEAPPKDRYLTKDEARHLIEKSPPFLRNIIVLALGTGMRKDEIFSLTWDDIFFDERFMYGQITVIGKGEKRRTIRMNKAVFDLFKHLEKEKNNHYVFPSPKTGKKLTAVRKSFTSALESSCIENFRFHDLRHTAASWMVMEGVSLYAVKEILGHSDIKTTQRYAHLSPGYLENEIGKLDNYLVIEKTSTDDHATLEKVAIRCSSGN